MADEEFDLQTMSRVKIIEWMRENGYDGPTSYTKKDLIERIIPNWQNPPEPAAEGEGEESNVKPISKAKRSRKAAASEGEEQAASAE